MQEQKYYLVQTEYTFIIEYFTSCSSRAPYVGREPSFLLVNVAIFLTTIKLPKLIDGRRNYYTFQYKSELKFNLWILISARALCR